MKNSVKHTQKTLVPMTDERRRDVYAMQNKQASHATIWGGYTPLTAKQARRRRKANNRARLAAEKAVA